MPNEEAKVEEVKPEQETIEYSVPKISRRALALFVDLFFIILTAFLLFAFSNMALEQSDWFKGVSADRNAIEEETGLYIDDVNLVNYCENNDALTTSEKNDLLGTTIRSFYENEKYCGTSAVEEYESRQMAYNSGGTIYFVEDPATGEVVEYEGADPSALYTFYSEEFLSYTLGYLSTYAPYAETTRFFFWASLIQMAIYLTVSLCIYWLIFPLTFWKRGKMTIGRKIFRISLVGRDGLSLRGWPYVLRFLFIYLIYIWVSAFSFLIPIIVSWTMVMLSKREQDLAEYVLNQYSVDSRNDDVYLDYGEYVDAMEHKKTVSLRQSSIFDPSARER